MPFLGWLDSRAAKAPRWIQRGATGDLLRAVAVTLDSGVETVRRAIKLRMPGQTTPDGLVALGEERLEARAEVFVYEDDRAFGERLRTSWSRRVRSGTKAGLETVFAAFGFPSFVVYDQGEWFASQRWRAWVYLRNPHLWGPPGEFGDGSKFGDGATFGSTATVNEVRNLRAVTASWVPPHTRTFLVFKTKPGLLFGEGGVFGDGSTFSDPGVCRIRLGKGPFS